MNPSMSTYFKNGGHHFRDELSKHRFESLSDVEIRCGDQKGVFLTQRILLASASPLLSDVLRPIPEGETATLIIPDVEEKDVECLLDLLYTGKCLVPDLQSVFELCKLLTVNHGLSVSMLSEVQNGESEMPTVKEEEDTTDYYNLNSLVEVVFSPPGQEQTVDHFASADPVSEHQLSEMFIQDDCSPNSSTGSMNVTISDTRSKDDVACRETDVGDDGATALRCQFCSLPCPSTLKLAYHMLVHDEKNDGGRFECDECKARFRHDQFLEYHKKKLHKKQPLPKKASFQCRVCMKRFQTNHELTMHGTIHSDERPFQCDVCNAAFKRRDTMKEHRSTHLPGRLKCEICQKAFRRKPNLFRHMRHAHVGIIS